jgi:mannan endo-1,6-alpha-mannosidase
MAALEVVLSNMISVVKPPVTNTTGGTSLGDPNAGAKKPAIIPPYLLAPPSRGDMAGAGMLTIIVIAGMMSLFIWICMRETDSENN